MGHISEGINDINPVWMSPQQIEDPRQLIDHFCKTQSVDDCRFFLWKMLRGSISAETHHVNAPVDKQISFFEKLMPLIEAVYLLSPVNQDLDLAEIAEGKKEVETQGDSSPKEKPDCHNVKGLGAYHISQKRKFKKKRKYLKSHSIWFREAVKNPFGIIDAFFDAYSLLDFRTSLFDVLQAVSEDHFYDMGSPVDVLFLLERWESIINAAYLLEGIHLDFKHQGPDFLREKWANEAGAVETSLDMLPSLLSEEEMADPQQVLISFFKYKSLKEWKQELIEINSFALSKHPAHEWEVHIHSLSAFVYSVKLAEALFIMGCYR